MAEISREQMAAMCRLLINSGDMTPMAERQIMKLFPTTESK